MNRVKWIIRFVALTVVAAAIGTGAVALSSRSRLDSAERAIESAWADLRPQLVERYAKLIAANEVVRTEGGGARSIVGEIDAAALDWESSLRTNAAINSQIGAANQLEGLGRRLERTISASPRFEVESILTAYAAFARSEIDASTLNDRVDRFDDYRGGRFRRIITAALGHEDLPRLQT